MNKPLQKSEWDAVAGKWDKIAGDTGDWHKQHDIDPVVLKMIGSVKGKKILEVGCGNGYLSRKIAKIGAKVTAIDISSEFIDLARKREKERPLGITYFVHDAARLKGLKNNNFDKVIANMVLMDTADAKRAVREISRVLKKNGVFIFSISHPAFDEFHWDILKKKGKKRFGRFVYRYLSPYAEMGDVIPGIIKNLTGYHRSLETYMRYLDDSKLQIDQFREIATTNPVTKAAREDGDINLRRSKYRTLKEKKMKEIAGKEIPLFLIISARKK